MQQAQACANPFAMMLDPERILRAVEASERLNHLHSRICRPLDKAVAAAPSAGAEFDLLVDGLPDDERA
ncbi:MAG: hypothetical protein IV092_07590 [Burkholderiaceae bacterium]|nr:hypothetical protein [Burkholderiaceae bacterium]